jgi:rsbT antagonist protein RsbS
MRSPILKQNNVLIASVQGELTDAELIQLRDDLIESVRRHRSTGVIIDVTLLDVMDSYAARTLRGITQTTRLLGATAVVAGIQPEVAFAMAQLGLRLTGTTTALDLEEALALLADLERRGRSRDDG